METISLTPTREEVVTAALQLFALRGFAATDMADIADYLATTEEVVLQHFPTKDALLQDILEPTLTRIDRVLSRHATEEPATDATAIVTDLIDVIADSGPQVAALLDDPATGARVYSNATDSALTARIESVLANRIPHEAQGKHIPQHLLREAIHMRAACAVAAIPAGIAAWQEVNPAIPVIDLPARRTLTDIILGILTPSPLRHAAPYR